MRQVTILLLAIILLCATISYTEAVPSRQLRYIKGPAAAAANNKLGNANIDQVVDSECDCPGIYCGPECTCCVA